MCLKRQVSPGAGCLSWVTLRCLSARPGPSTLLISAGIKPEEVDILITNCSIFCPTPSLSSMLINKFKLRRDIQAYHLGGMGCSVGVIAVGLVRDMLQVRNERRACRATGAVTVEQLSQPQEWQQLNPGSFPLNVFSCHGGCGSGNMGLAATRSITASASFPDGPCKQFYAK